MWQPWRIWLATPAVLMLLLLVDASALHRKIIDPESTDAAALLDPETFNRTLALQQTPYAIVEFFANWCPACRNYKPQYEQVARLFNGHKAAYPGFLYLAKVDCAIPTSKVLCDRYGVTRFPTLFWGSPKALALGSAKAPELVDIDDFRNLLQWINKHTQRDFVLPAAEARNSDNVNAVLTPRPVQVYDIEEATAQAADWVFKHMLSPTNSKGRVALIKFLQLLVLHHPSKRCRVGSANILASLHDLWPSEKKSSTGDAAQDYTGGGFSALRDIRICGDTFPSGTWKTCKGSKADSRGYTCGLWLLFHSLSVRVEDWESSAALKAIQDFVSYFFNCEDCRAHFMDLSKTMGDVASQKELVLWLWRAHNEVNKRLIVEEAASGSGDPEFPKVLWPPKYFCDSCIIGSEPKAESENLEPKWNESAVLSYLSALYGPDLIPSYKDSSARRVKRTQLTAGDTEESSGSSVPIGAAIAVALASCGFGVAACCWRMQQKRRKYVPLTLVLFIPVVLSLLIWLVGDFARFIQVWV